MNASIKALESLFHNFNSENSQAAFLEISAIILTDDDFLEKVKKFDAAIEKHNVYNEVGEYAFDLMMIHHLSNFIKDEDIGDLECTLHNNDVFSSGDQHCSNWKNKMERT